MGTTMSPCRAIIANVCNSSFSMLSKCGVLLNRCSTSTYQCTVEIQEMVYLLERTKSKQVAV